MPINLPNNYLDYPDNIEKPYELEIDEDTYKVNSYKFQGMQEFYDFLKQNPKINNKLWRKSYHIASMSNDYDFAGVPYEKAVEKIITDMDPGYQEFLKIERNITARSGMVHKYKDIKTIAGGFIDPVAYTTGSPEIYRASRIQKKPKFITIDTQIGYSWSTSKSQVFNRALIITNLIKALEKRGYIVNVNSFMVTLELDEIVKAVFTIKKQGKAVNYQALYKSLVDVEFFRRLCFRLIEISDVHNSGWVSHYGATGSEEIARQLLNLKKDDIYFDQPNRMGINGRDIGVDFENVAKKLHLEDVFEIEREKELLRESVRVLKKH